MLKTIYDRWILNHPYLVIFFIILLIAFLGYEARKLEVDASAETLVLEDDEDLRLTRQVNARYGSPDYLIITYSPEDDLLSDKTLENIRRLRDDLIALEGVESVVSLLDVPLLESPPMPVKEMVKSVRTLESPEAARGLAKKEFLSSPIYSDMLVSPDFKTTALQVNLPEDEVFRSLLKRRNELKEKLKEGTITAEERMEFDHVKADFKIHRDRMRIKQHENIALVRGIMDKYRGEADLFLGGVSMVADDLITYVKNDLKIFGTAVMLFLVITLWIIFRQKRWVIIPILCCGFSVVATSGLLGMFGWEVTVISSNFISIQIIITMAVTIHLIVRYRELLGLRPEADQRELILHTVTSMAKPCAYAILTTMAGFSSLILCNILPVINFGWMMTAGIGVSLVLTFLIFPSILMLVDKRAANTSFENHFIFTKILARFTESFGRLIMWVSGILMVASVAGGAMLIVENSFIDYFKDTTEIYQGMTVIDKQLGGTTPLDVVIKFVEEPEASEQDSSANSEPDNEFDDEFDDFEEEFEAEKGKAQYWFTSRKMTEVEKVHDYLDSIPETGKVMSLGTMLKVGKSLNDGEPLDNFKLALIYNELPERFRKIILSPYVSVENNEVRFSIRVRDSDKNLRRNELIKKIRRDLAGDFELEKENIKLAGLVVLYNNMLQSLFNSQILTLGAVVFILMFMFLILFRSLKIALIAIFPNLLSVGAVLGFMGWVKIPLDMMTITIAAISVGIAVDDTIHYIHRFKREYANGGTYLEIMHRCHSSIGYAMYYTSVTIVIGFSILLLSNFIPSIYFGILTVLAMVIALVAALTLLPQLIIVLKPFGPDREKV
ncbi:MAG: MMPL family transporter [Deltaproteobacteria bacterium]|nr:MMPL family transporter [Deltaproteobacteria bacterium]